MNTRVIRWLGGWFVNCVALHVARETPLDECNHARHIWLLSSPEASLFRLRRFTGKMFYYTSFGYCVHWIIDCCYFFFLAPRKKKEMEKHAIKKWVKEMLWFFPHFTDYTTTKVSKIWAGGGVCSGSGLCESGHYKSQPICHQFNHISISSPSSQYRSSV